MNETEKPYVMSGVRPNKTWYQPTDEYLLLPQLPGYKVQARRRPHEPKPRNKPYTFTPTPNMVHRQLISLPK